MFSSSTDEASSSTCASAPFASTCSSRAASTCSRPWGCSGGWWGVWGGLRGLGGLGWVGVGFRGVWELGVWDFRGLGGLSRFWGLGCVFECQARAHLQRHGGQDGQRQTRTSGWRGLHQGDAEPRLAFGTSCVFPYLGLQGTLYRYFQRVT